ncbi:MAG: C_GCAxxG_C_C family protein [Firmicutes bacterium]|nr:C_GCAxxG_C_C family protein [Bacillota bacterium]
MKEEKMEKMSRREFLVGTGGFAAGAAVGAVLGGGVFNLLPAAAAEATYPYPYVKLDPEKVRKYGYELYYQGGCMYGAASAIIKALAEEVGAPFSSFPVDMFKYGAGGVAGWGTICGTVNGAAAVINLVAPKPEAFPMISELLGWYSETPLPSKKLDAIAKFQDQAQSVATTPLCHSSVSNWCEASGQKESSPQRLDRCAKLTGDVAAKAVELLNAWKDGKFAPVYKVPAETAKCMGCHVGKDSMLNNSFGKMNCTSCHDDHTK